MTVKLTPHPFMKTRVICEQCYNMNHKFCEASGCQCPRCTTNDSVKRCKADEKNMRHTDASPIK